MPKYNYVAMDAHGKETKGTLEVATQNEAIGRVKEMGLFPTKKWRKFAISSASDFCSAIIFSFASILVDFCRFQSAVLPHVHSAHQDP